MMTVSAEALARLAGLLADRTRAGFCLALLDGRAWTVGELAHQAGVGLPAASEQLTHLVEAGLLVEQRQGRHRYLRLADPQVARMIEDLAAHLPGSPSPGSTSGSVPRTGLRTVKVSAALAAGRTCYDHLAGRLGVSIADTLAGRGLVEIEDGASLTPAGSAWLGDLGIEVDALRGARRPLIRTCLDWTERRQHLAGAVGAAICQNLVARNWIEAGPIPRSMGLTAAGRRELPSVLILDPVLLA